jgi:hypothetical protein
VDARDKPGHDEVFYSPRAALAGIAADPNGERSDPARTIRQFAACNSNVKRTARHLDLHTNTVYFRLNRIRDLTGIDARSYSGLSLLLTTVRMMGAGRGASDRLLRRRQQADARSRCIAARCSSTMPIARIRTEGSRARASRAAGG